MAIMIQEVEYFVNVQPPSFNCATLTAGVFPLNYPDVFLNQGKDVQVLSVRGFLDVFSFVQTPGQPPSVAGNRSLPLNPRWTFFGFWRLIQNRLYPNTPGVIGPGPVNAFFPTTLSFSLTSEKPDYSPACLFASGMRFGVLNVYLGSLVTLNNVNFGSFRIQFEVEV